MAATRSSPVAGAPSKDLIRVSRFNKRVLNLLNEMAKLLDRSRGQKEALLSEGKQDKDQLKLRIKEITKAREEVERFANLMRSALPSDTRMMKTFARDVYQPYKQCSLMQTWGYNLISEELTERSLEDLEAYVYKTSDIARGDECIGFAHATASITSTKKKVVKEEGQENKKKMETGKEVSEEEEGEPYRSQAEAAVTSIEDFLKEAQQLLLFGQPTEEEAAAFLHAKLRGLANSFSRKVKKANVNKIVEAGIASGDHGRRIVGHIFTSTGGNACWNPRGHRRNKSHDDKASAVGKSGQEDPDQHQRLLKDFAHKAKKAGSNAVKLVPPKKSILRVVRAARTLLRLVHGLVRGKSATVVSNMRQPLRRLLGVGFGVAVSAEADGFIKALTEATMRNSILGKHLSGIAGEVMSYLGLGAAN